MNTRTSLPVQCCILLLSIVTLVGCIQQSESRVVVFSALDREFSEPIFKDFTKSTDIQVLAKYDTESTKTVGLANQILQQKETAACDLFWNNEILHTLRLEQAGKLTPLPKDSVAHFPASFRSSSDQWIGLAARARVIIVNTKLLPSADDYPTSIMEMAEPKWKGNTCLAKPLFGTTATHFAVLFQQMGPEAFNSLITKIQNNEVAILSGNRQVAADVAAGKYAWGITDTDDFNIELQAGSPVKLVFPDQAPKQSGCLLIPNTLALIKGGENAQEAITLSETILSGGVERELSQGPSAQFPLSDQVKERSPLWSDDVRWMAVDWSKTVDAWEQSSKILTRVFY